MIFAIGMLLIFLGLMGTTMDIFVPVVDMATSQMVGISNLFGMMLIIVGVIVIGVRGFSTGASALFDLPSDKHTILFHHRRGKNPNVSILVGKLLDLEYISSKGKIFKDTGGGFRLAGHDCRTTHETIAFDLPEWLMDYFYHVKKDFGIRNRDEWIKTLKQIRDMVRPPFPDKNLLEKELNKVDVFKPLLKDEKKREELLRLGFDKIKNIEIFCCDGVTHHHEEIEEFIESATPNEIDTLVKQKYLNDRMREKNYQDPGSSFDYSNLIPIGVGMMLAAMAVIILMSYLGS